LELAGTRRKKTFEGVGSEIKITRVLFQLEFDEIRRKKDLSKDKLADLEKGLLIN